MPPVLLDPFPDNAVEVVGATVHIPTNVADGRMVGPVVVRPGGIASGRSGPHM